MSNVEKYARYIAEENGGTPKMTAKEYATHVRGLANIRDTTESILSDPKRSDEFKAGCLKEYWRQKKEVTDNIHNNAGEHLSILAHMHTKKTADNTDLEKEFADHVGQDYPRPSATTKGKTKK